MIYRQLLLSCVFVAGAFPSHAEVLYGSNEAVGKYVDIDDVRLYYEIYGEGEPLLLIHGNGSSIWAFQLQIPELSKHFRVIAVDSRAQGRSTDSDKDISYALMARDMVGLLDHLEVDATHVLGWSDGGIVGLEMAFAFPERVRRLIAIGANFTPAAGSVFPYKDEKPTADPSTLTPEQQRTMSLLKQRASSPPLAPQHERAKLVREKLDRLMAEHPNFSKEQLGTIKTPTLVVAGDHDLIYDEHTVELFHALPNAQLWIAPGTSHWLPWERPDALNEHALNFFTQPFLPFDRYYVLHVFGKSDDSEE